MPIPIICVSDQTAVFTHVARRDTHKLPPERIKKSEDQGANHLSFYGKITL